MTLKEHIKTTKRLVKVRKNLMAMCSSNNPRCFKKIYKSEALRLIKEIQRIDDVRNILDGVYYDFVDKETFQKLGFIYYGGK